MQYQINESALHSDNGTFRLCLAPGSPRLAANNAASRSGKQSVGRVGCLVKTESCRDQNNDRPVEVEQVPLVPCRQTTLLLQ